MLDLSPNQINVTANQVILTCLIGMIAKNTNNPNQFLKALEGFSTKSLPGFTFSNLTPGQQNEAREVTGQRIKGILSGLNFE